MRLDGKLASQLTEDDLKQLIDDRRQEDRYIDYKRDAYGKADADKRELLKDVVGFANASGGIIFIGIEENASNIPIALPGVEPDVNRKDPMERYERTIRTGIEPRLAGVMIEPIPVGSTDRVVIAIGVPQSLSRPHRVRTNGSERWTIRHNRDTIDMTYTEIRSAFLDIENIGRRVRQFQKERCDEILTFTNTSPERKGALAIHVIPLFTEGKTLDVQAALSRTNDFFPPGLSNSFPLHPNLDGVVARGQLPRTDDWWGWFQLYHDGRIEGVFGNLVRIAGEDEDRDRRLLMHHGQLETYLFEAVPAYIHGIAALGFHPPYAVAVSLINAQGSEIHQQLPSSQREMEELIARLDPVVIESANLTGAWHSVLRPILDQLWNAYGFPTCPSFNDDGLWRGASR